MAILIVTVSLVIVLLIYLFFCYKTKRYINVLTPMFIIAVPSRYLFEIGYLLMYQQDGSNYGYLITFLLYILDFAGLVVGYLVIKSHVLVKLTRVIIVPSWLSWMTLLIALLVFLPVLLEFSEFILAPREIYVRTRTGYGLNYFGSLFFANLSFIVFLFSRRINLLSRILFLGILFFVVGAHGSKGAFVTLFFIYLMYLVYIRNISQSFAITFRYVIVLGVVMTTLFYFTLPETMKENLLNGIVNYSDYTRHAVMVVDDPPKAQYGKLMFEDNVISLIPRKVYPQKPKDYGSFYLSKYYFPEWFYGDTGSPAFGVGTYFADFREASLVVIFFLSMGIGMLTKIFVNRVMRYKSPSDFIMLLYFAGVPLLNIGAGSLLIPHLVMTLLIALFVNLFRRVNLN